jgi:hypothetical protein
MYYKLFMRYSKYIELKLLFSALSVVDLLLLYGIWRADSSYIHNLTRLKYHAYGLIL